MFIILLRRVLNRNIVDIREIKDKTDVGIKMFLRSALSGPAYRVVEMVQH